MKRRNGDYSNYIVVKTCRIYFLFQAYHISVFRLGHVNFNKTALITHSEQNDIHGKSFLTRSTILACQVSI